MKRVGRPLEYVDDSTWQAPAFPDRKLFMLDLPDAGIFEFQEGCQKELALDQENFLFI